MNRSRTSVLLSQPIVRWTIALALLVVPFGAVGAAEADADRAPRGRPDIDVRAGYYADDAEGPFVGAGVLMRVASGTRWYFNPNVEFAFGDHVDVVTVNADFHYDFARESGVSFWLGAGPAVVRRDPDFGLGDAETDLGINGFFGFGASRGHVRPFFQLKVLASDESELVLAGGVRF